MIGDGLMNTKIPFTKDILFEKKVSEITSISLEHEIKVEESTLKGNFIVSGDYKSHEVKNLLVICFLLKLNLLMILIRKLLSL